MRLAKIMENDTVDCDSGICVSVWFQGCPHRCKGCHNPETWNFEDGQEINNEEAIKQIIELIDKNGIKRDLSILGGEPLAFQNIDNTIFIINKIREKFKNIKIYLWTGYTLEEIQENEKMKKVKELIDVLIEGRYIEEQRDITLELRGSKNQRIIRN